MVARDDSMDKGIVAPARERGLKLKRYIYINDSLGRSREGAWIEIMANRHQKDQDFVAPARERGLK